MDIALCVKTRPQRRRTVNNILKLLSDIIAAEQRYMDNMPENLQSSCIFENAEQTVSVLEEAAELLGEAY